MKTASTYILAICLLASLWSVAAAQEGAPPAREFRPTDPGEAERILEKQWWRQADESLQPGRFESSGKWLIGLQLYDESDRLVGEHELTTADIAPASLKSMPVGGQYGVGDFSTLDDYRLLLWMMPAALEPTFREYGYLDWPDRHDGTLVVKADGTPLETDPVILSEDQKRELFNQMLEQAQSVEINGLRIYIFSSRARQAKIELDWVDAVDIPAGKPGPLNNSERMQGLREYARPVADITLNFPEGK